MSRILPLAVAAGALALTPAVAQKRSAKEAAQAFSLDSATLSGDPAPIATPTPTSTPEAVGSADPSPAPTPTTVVDDTPPPPTTLEMPAVAAPTVAPVASPAADAPIVTRLGPAPSLDTPIAQLIADPRTKAVLDKDMPGLSTDENLIRFQQFSLRRFQSMTGGQLTPALLDKVGADLAALDEQAVTTLDMTATPAKPRRGKQDDGR